MSRCSFRSLLLLWILLFLPGMEALALVSSCRSSQPVLIIANEQKEERIYATEVLHRRSKDHEVVHNFTRLN